VATVGLREPEMVVKGLYRLTFTLRFLVMRYVSRDKDGLVCYCSRITKSQSRLFSFVCDPAIHLRCFLQPLVVVVVQVEAQLVV